MAGQRNPDIQRLLANLRGTVFQQDTTQDVSSPVVRTDSTNVQTPLVASSSIPGLGFEQQQRSSPPSTGTPQSSTQSSALAAASRDISRSVTPSVPDASTITTWPAALKHVTKHVISNERSSGKIKHLISEQHKHEKQWWEGREAIIARHSGRAGNQAKAAALLRSLGGAAIPVAAQDSKSDQKELEAYDQKVYKSLTDMVADFDRQLRGLQVPFFAIKHDLVILEDGVSKGSSLKGRIDKGELRELQRRMIETLEDLLGDD